MLNKFKLITKSSRLYSLNTNAQDAVDYLTKINLHKCHNHINGDRIDGSGSVFDNLNPATGRIMNRVNCLSNDEIDKCIEHAIHAQQIWSRFSIGDKFRIIVKAANLIRSKATILATVDVLDTGKAFWESEGDIYNCADCLEMFASFLYSNEGAFVPLQRDSFYYTKREPLGVCVGIGAWNFPFQMITWKSAPAIVAGNSFIFKPSPLTPLSAILLSEIYHEAGVPKGLISIIQGGADVGNYITQHSKIAKVSFTGSVTSGKKVMETGSGTLKQLTLELGGKSPLIIFDDADVIESVKGILLANFLTQGEVCSNGTRVYISTKIYSQIEHELVEAVKTLKIGDPFDKSVSIGAMISEDQYNIVMKYIESAKKDGAKILYGGSQAIFPKSSFLSNGKYITPCVIGDCHDEMKVVQEEIFGPVVSLLKFDCETDVIQRANNSTLGLSGGLFTKDINRAHRVAAQLQCGNVYINTYNAYPPGMPFGGIKQSGFGRENCRQTLDHYSQLKSIFVESQSIEYPFWPTK